MTTPPVFKLDRFLPYRLSVAANAVSEAVAQTYRSLYGLKTPEWRVIAVLAEEDSLTPQAIGARTRMDKVTVSRAAMTLVERDLARRAPNPQDQRSHTLSLTPAGLALYADIAPRALAIEAQVFADFSQSDRQALLSLLRKAEGASADLPPP